MADKVDKPKKKAKPAKQDEKGVMAALPSTRPERIGSRRGATSAPAPKTTASTRASKAAATKASAKPAAKKAPARPRAAATQRKAAAPRTFEPTQAAETAAGPADSASLRPSPPPAGAVPLHKTPPTGEERTYPRPRAVTEGAPGIGRTGYRDEHDGAGRPGGVELAATAVRAAGEVAQLGLSISGHVLKRVVRRLPKP